MTGPKGRLNYRCVIELAGWSGRASGAVGHGPLKTKKKPSPKDGLVGADLDRGLEDAGIFGPKDHILE